MSAAATVSDPVLASRRAISAPEPMPASTVCGNRLASITLAVPEKPQPVAAVPPLPCWMRSASPVAPTDSPPSPNATFVGPDAVRPPPGVAPSRARVVLPTPR